MEIKAKIRYTQLTLSEKLQPFATNTAEETSEKLEELLEILFNADSRDCNGPDIMIEDPSTYLVINDKGEDEVWIGKQADLLEIYTSKEFNVYDLYITYLP